MSSLIEKSFLNLQRVEGLSGWMAQWTESEGFQIFSGEEANLPATSSGSDCSVIFEGFLHNRKEVIAGLGDPILKPSNDADIVRFAFSRWHDDLVYRLRGVFSIAIWDKRTNALWYVRDHCGIYPSFYATSGSHIIFSTSIADIVRHPKVSSTLNRSATAF